MEENLKKLIKNKSLSFKLNLLFIISLSEIESVDKYNSIKDLQFELEAIKSIQKLNDPYFLKFL